MSMLASLGQFGLALGQGFQQKQEELKKEAEKKAQQEREYRRQDTADRQAAESHDLSMQTNRQSMEQSKATFENEQRVNQIKMDAFQRQEVLRKGLGAVMAARMAGDMDGAFGGLAALTEQLAQTKIDFDRDPATGKILLDNNGRAKAFALDANGKRTGNWQLVSVDEGVRNVYMLADPVADYERTITAQQKAAERAAEQANDLEKLRLQSGTQIKVAEIGAGSRLDAAALGAGSRVEVAEINANKGQSGGGKGSGRTRLNHGGSAFIPPPAQYVPMFKSAGERHGINPLYLAAMAQTESSYNPNAKSGAGAVGLMQLMAPTGESVGVAAHQRTDPQASLNGGARYYRQMLDKYKDELLATAAYNAGPGTVDAAIKKNRARGLPTDFASLKLPQETRDYVQRVTSRYQQAQAAYGNSPTGNPGLDSQVHDANAIAQNVGPTLESWVKRLGIGGKDDSGNPVALTEAQAKTQAALAGSMQNATVALTRMVQAKDAQTRGTYYGKAHAAIAETLQNRVGLEKSQAVQMAHQIASELAGYDSLTDLATWQRLGGYVAPNPNAEEAPTSKGKPPASQKATAPNPYAPPAAGTTTQATVVNPTMVGNYRLGVKPPQAKQDDVDQRAIRGALQ